MNRLKIRRFTQAEIERFWRPLWRWLISRLPWQWRQSRGGAISERSLAHLEKTATP
jgi:hypothetical protein